MVELQYEKSIKRWVNYFALADDTGEIWLLCSPGQAKYTPERGNWFEWPKNDDVIPFYVINGAWNGTLYRQKNLVKIDSKTSRTAFLVWAGDIPEDICGYNEMIHWVQKQI